MPGLKLLTISHIAMTISWTARGINKITGCVPNTEDLGAAAVKNRLVQHPETKLVTNPATSAAPRYLGT